MVRFGMKAKLNQTKQFVKFKITELNQTVPNQKKVFYLVPQA